MYFKLLLTLFLFTFALSVQAQGPLLYELESYDPVANADSIVVSGQARFTVLTERLIRLEYDLSAQFEDRATLAFVNRKLPVPEFTQDVTDGLLTITTSKLRLTYQTGKQFDAQTLTIEGIGGGALDFKGTWHYGDDNYGNLYGTLRTLDNYIPLTMNCTWIANQKIKTHPEDQHCAWGAISTLGWNVYNDSQNVVLNEQEWWVGTNADLIDDYFSGAGLDFKGALKDFTSVGGKVPIIPRYALGTWWSRWFGWNDRGLRAFVTEFEKYSLPLDVMVIDMNWHKKDSWGGYSWDENLLPNATTTTRWLRNKGLALSLNLHDNSGVCPYDNQYDAFCQAMGLDPALKQCVGFQICSSEKYALNLEDYVLRPLVLAQGVDIWWIDWQQGGQNGGCNGYALNPTFWLNKLRVTDERRQHLKSPKTEIKRTIVLSRWGGLGNHRYQVGFSGDVPLLTWFNLALQPYYSATSANVAYGYWSHDFTGPGFGMELYTRWSQFGAYSGILRFHERGQSSGQCSAYQFPTPPGGFPTRLCIEWAPFDAPYQTTDLIRSVTLERAALMPYLYTQARLYFETGVAFMRPLYYDYPLENLAYEVLTLSGKFAQYSWGEDMIIAPIVSHSEKSTNLVEDKKIWVPPGNWIDDTSGQWLQGSSWHNKSWDITEIPVLVKQGAIIARRPADFLQQNLISNARLDFANLQFDVYPGAESSTTAVYEDDGLTEGYLVGEFAYVYANYSVTSTGVEGTELLIFNVWQSQGVWDWRPRSRYITLRLKYSHPPTLVRYRYVDVAQEVVEVIVPHSLFVGEPGTWWYEGVSTAAVIRLPKLSEAQLPAQVLLDFAPQTRSRNDRLSGLAGALAHAAIAMYNLDETHSTPGSLYLGNATLIQAAVYGQKLEFYSVRPTQFAQAVEEYSTLFNQAYESILNVQPNGVEELDPEFIRRRDYSLALLRATTFYNAAE